MSPVLPAGFKVPGLCDDWGGRVLSPVISPAFLPPPPPPSTAPVAAATAVHLLRIELEMKVRSGSFLS